MRDVREQGTAGDKEAANAESSGGGRSTNSPNSAPSILLPKGGGAIRGMGEKFAANPVTGTGSMSVPIAASPGRSGFGPQLSLSYDSGAGNGAFGFGWNLSIPSITRKTDKGLPKYQDALESDVFILSGSEDLVPVMVEHADEWIHEIFERVAEGASYRVQRYRPRVEGLFARIERWTNQSDPADTFWRSITRDNITTFYGKTDESRIADPADPRHIFSWLICKSYDDKGNAIVYEYVREDSAGIDLSQVHERNRTDESRSANRYLKRIKYGNRTSRLVEPDLSSASWLFELALDYDEGHYEPLPADADARQLVRADIEKTLDWPARRDPFSSHRAGFEVRTYRLCHRVLMFHHFPDELGVDDYLVRSTDFVYDEGPIASFITRVTQSGYVRQTDGSYLKKSLPPLEFEYTRATVQEEIREIDAESLENLPVGLDGSQYQWIDLDGEGVTGILSEQNGAWYYKPNIGDARFGNLQTVTTLPAIVGGGGQRHQFLDLAGDGQLDVVQFSGPVSGFYERTAEGGWDSLRTFRSLPNVDWGDPNLRFIDLTGDGLADVLITEDEAFTWAPSLGEEGFGSFELVHRTLDEERGPKLILADREQSVYLADMCGDGLTDLVRIRNGEVCYWANLGYGRFGAKVTLDNAPWFDNPDLFDQKRVRLADIDGSGTNDIIYLGRDGVDLYFNQSGNGWSEPRRLSNFPAVDNLSSIMTADLLGNGTACLVWSSPLLTDARRPARYIDLMGGQKAHLLTRSVNNLGAETLVRYVASTKFYLADKLAGKPWITRINFPVHVVERVETYDRVSRNRFVTRYAYHHGYFDGVEREFRGFGMVEQFDTEEFAALSSSDQFPTGNNIDAASHVPPVHTKTWFHTGAYLGRDRISNFYAGLLEMNNLGEYYREPGLDDAAASALLLEDTVLPDGLSTDEQREACRALKGSILRQEVYAIDGTLKANQPYSVSERNYTITMLQPLGGNLHAVFFTHPRETIDYHYERNPADPRLSHALTLEVDLFGNVLKSAAVGYGRRRPDPELGPQDAAKQTLTLVTYTENSVTNSISDDDSYRAPMPSEARTYELTGYTPSGPAGRFRISDFVRRGRSGLVHVFDREINYEDQPTAGRQRRPIERARTYYRPDDLGTRENDPLTLLPFGSLEQLAIPGESYKLAFTPGLLAQVYQRPHADQPPEVLMPNPGDILAADIPGGRVADRGGYVDLDHDGHWWIPSGRIFHSPGTDDTAAAERAYARGHLFLAQRYRDPFGETSIVAFDGHDLLMAQTRDPMGNLVTAGERDAAGNLVTSGNDYRVLQPKLVMDPNRNRSAAVFDALGMLVGTAVMGKPEENLGDSLDGFEPDLTDAAVLDHLENPFVDPQSILQRATTRLVYDLFAYGRTANDAEPQSAVVYTLARETHDSDLGPGQQTKIQHHFCYSDGFGREIQRKIQAEPGPVVDGGPDVRPRWVGSGWTIFNNKGKPVRQYEPFFSATHSFEFARITGVSPILFYDPVERVVATLRPNHTFEKVVFDPWRQKTYDCNDTVLVADPKNDPDVGSYFKRLPAADYLPTWYAERQAGALGRQEQTAAAKAAAHADTPTVAYFDTLGRPFMSVADNGVDSSDNRRRFRTRTYLDIEGNHREVIDARDRAIMRYDYDMLSKAIHSMSVDAGERWMLNNAAGKPVRKWDSRDHTIKIAYDAVQRPTHLSVSQASGREVSAERVIYGEAHPSAEALNLRRKLYQHYDGAGVAADESYDFKGNLLNSSRQLAIEYKQQLDWSALAALSDAQAIASPPDSLLESEVFTTSTEFDALNRRTELITPDKSETRYAYNEANLLERIDSNLRGAVESTQFVTGVSYDAKGQRLQIDYGNGATTRYEYDEKTFRLTRLRTRRASDGAKLQDLNYTYDPVGNITAIRDDAQQAVYFKNQVVTTNAEYEYDAIYRLIKATGREHLGQAGGHPNAPKQPGPDDSFWTNLSQPGDGSAMGNYTECYVYDEVGNILKMAHAAASGGWTRNYQYDHGSNRLLLTSNPSGSLTESYDHDAHGNMVKMPHLPLMRWDCRDQLQTTAQQVFSSGEPETTWYVYDSGGQRVRKVTERMVAAGQTPAGMKERVCVGGFEVYREYESDGSTVKLERETLHIMDDKQRIALVETRTQGNDLGPAQLMRYQYGNHLDTVHLEVDHQGRTISYEEYTPYGSTTYQAVDSQTETPKRYRYTGKERDEESGLYYHGARYYPSWLARWFSPDPAGPVDGVNLYQFVRGNPVGFKEASGLYAESGHFYTVYYVSLAAGFSEEIAFKNAYFAQLPDEVRELDAMETAGKELGLGSSIDRRNIHHGLHALTGGSSKKEREFTKAALHDYQPGSLEFGLLLHRLGDTFAHSTVEDESKLYDDPEGHARAGTGPDNPANRPELYRAYVKDLLSVLTEKSGKVGMSDEEIDAFVKEVTSVKTNEKQSEKIIKLARARKDKDFPELKTFDKSKRPEDEGGLWGLPVGLPSIKDRPGGDDLLNRSMALAKRMTRATDEPVNYVKEAVLWLTGVTVVKAIGKTLSRIGDQWRAIKYETLRGLTDLNNWAPGPR